MEKPIELEDIIPPRGELRRRWTCEGLTEGIEKSNSINKIRKKIDFPLFNVKNLSQAAFKKMLRYARSMDILRSAVVDAIINKSVHRLAGLTRKETRKKVDFIVERHLKSLPMRWQNLSFCVADILVQMRLILKYKRRKLTFAVCCHNLVRKADSDKVFVDVSIICSDRLKMLSMLPVLFENVAISIPNAEMMNFGAGLVCLSISMVSSVTLVLSCCKL